MPTVWPVTRPLLIVFEWHRRVEQKQTEVHVRPSLAPRWRETTCAVSISEWVPARELRANTRPGLDTHSARARHELDPDSTCTRPAHDARVLATLAVICTVPDSDYHTRDATAYH